METPARTVELLIWLVGIVSAFGGGNLLLNIPECEVGTVCSYPEMIDWKLGLGLLSLSLISIILGIQAIIARNGNKKIWIALFFDNRTIDEVIGDSSNEDDVSHVSDGWARMEEEHLTSRFEEE